MTSQKQWPPVGKRPSNLQDQAGQLIAETKAMLDLPGEELVSYDSLVPYLNSCLDFFAEVNDQQSMAKAPNDTKSNGKEVRNRQSTDYQPFRLLDLPSEIRNRIYSILMVDEDSWIDDGHGKLIQDHIGGLVIRELSPTCYDPAWLRTSYTTRDWSFTGESQRTTYHLDSYYLKSRPAVQLFLVSRQICTEARFIFYDRNRFFVDTIDTLIPFIKDRPSGSHLLISSISIPLPYGDEMDEYGDRMPRASNVREATLEQAFQEVMENPNLRLFLDQLDVRVWDENKDSRGLPSVDHTSFTVERLQQLGSLAITSTVTISNFDWYECSSRLEKDLLFEPLPKRTKIRMLQI